MTSMFKAALVSSWIVIGACSDDASRPHGINGAPDPGVNEVQVVTPEFTIPAGTERFVCMTIDYDLT